MLMVFLSNIIFNSFAFLIVLSVVAFIHELGHYLVAKYNGVAVEEFAIGYGKELFGKTDKNGTRWKVCILPFGGFCKFFGDEDMSSSIKNKDKIDKLTYEEKQKCLLYKTPVERIEVAIAGPIFNYILGIFLFTIFFAIGGISEFSNVVGLVNKNSPAEQADIRSNDIIKKINGINTNNFEQIQKAITENKNKVITLEIVRDNQIINKYVKPNIIEKKDVLGKITKTQIIGITSTNIIDKKINIIKAVMESIKYVRKINKDTLIALGQMLIGKRSFNEISGPIKIAEYSGKAMRNGYMSMIYFTAIISISLGLMNLLPIPALDGGHIIFCILEIIRKKPLNEKTENIVTAIGISLLIVLMSFTMIKDIIGVL